MLQRSIQVRLLAAPPCAAALLPTLARRYFFKCGRTLQQELALQSTFYTRLVGVGEEPYAPNVFALGGTRPLFSFEQPEKNEKCDACSVIRLPLTLAGDTTLRAALPLFASYLGILPSDSLVEGRFVPRLKVGNATILHQDFDLLRAAKEEDVQMCRSVLSCAEGCAQRVECLVVVVWLYCGGVVGCAGVCHFFESHTESTWTKLFLI